MTPPGIDPGTIRLVAQRLKHYATPCPSTKFMKVIKKEIGLFAVSFQRKVYECFQTVSENPFVLHSNYDTV
jgi:hypothetical protein